MDVPQRDRGGSTWTPSLVQEGGFSHWKRVKEWEADPGWPDVAARPDDVGTTISEIVDRVKEMEEELGIHEDLISEAELDGMIAKAEMYAFDEEEDDDDALPF